MSTNNCDCVRVDILADAFALLALRCDMKVRFPKKINKRINFEIKNDPFINQRAMIYATFWCDKVTYEQINQLSEWADNIDVLIYNHILRK